MTVELTEHPLIREYGSLLKHVDRIPRSASEIYRRWTGWDGDTSLTRRRRRERRWCAKALVHMTREGVIYRGVLTEGDYTWVAFWRGQMDPAAPGSDQSRGAGDGGVD